MTQNRYASILEADQVSGEDTEAVLHIAAANDIPKVRWLLAQLHCILISPRMLPSVKKHMSRRIHHTIAQLPWRCRGPQAQA